MDDPWGWKVCRSRARPWVLLQRPFYSGLLIRFVSVSLSYNFTLAGAGQYTFSPASTTFYHMKADGSLATIEASTDAHATAHVSGQLVSSKTRKRLSKRTTYSSCSTSQKTGVNNGVTAYESLLKYHLTQRTDKSLQRPRPSCQLVDVSNNLFRRVVLLICFYYQVILTPTRLVSICTYAIGHLADRVTLGGTRYTYWFGTYSSSRFSRVKTTFTNLNNKFSTWWYDCSCTESGTYAYTYPSEVRIRHALHSRSQFHTLFAVRRRLPLHPLLQ